MCVDCSHASGESGSADQQGARAATCSAVLLLHAGSTAMRQFTCQCMLYLPYNILHAFCMLSLLRLAAPYLRFPKDALRWIPTICEAKAAQEKQSNRNITPFTLNASTSLQRKQVPCFDSTLRALSVQNSRSGKHGSLACCGCGSHRSVRCSDPKQASDLPNEHEHNYHGE